jgi:tRNA A-37 threonylcarbamoyl transferase component Bud32/tetratricopeptide (TPR) repeat protein
MKLSRDLWLQVEPLLTTALDMELSARPEWLARIEATHPEAAPILRRMLESDARAERSRELETVPRLAPAPEWKSAYGAGARIGPFEIIRPLGHGGMGEVWLARQADGRVERVVALKLPALSQQGEVWRERFRRERDILARLEHPHIARLYDAGVTDAGQPWLAMEFVEGPSLSEHMASRSLSIAERLALFRQVLAAVAHAHRHLVVHRDLKPANILVDASGQVKLLDFGIAKLVDEADAANAAADLTRMGGRVMTLRYAAPEQVAAGDITTATDIYALGVILHEMLTGLSPYRAVREGKPLTDVMLLREEAALPSGLVAKPPAWRLAGDLDAIILKAMRRDPAHRYASVELFDADILAHLEKRPVRARVGTWRYLAGRFAVRRKLPLAMAAAVLVTLLAGLVMAERERRVAVAEKARAERHFASVRKLANTFIFDVHREIETLPGSLKAREMLIATSLEYLDALAGETGKDPGLMYEMAVAYRNIGNIQGQPGAANKGDIAASIANFEKARGLFIELEKLKPDDLARMRQHRALSYALARAYFLAQDPRWRAEIDKGVKIAERLSARPGASPSDRSLVAITRGERVHLQSLISDPNPESAAEMAAALAILEPLVREAPDDLELRRSLVGMYARAAKLVGQNPTLEEAVVYLRKAIALAGKPPVDPRIQTHEETMLLAAALNLLGKYGEAEEAFGQARRLSEAAIAADPSNPNLLVEHIRIVAGSARVALKVGDPARAARLNREALALSSRLPPALLKTRDLRIDVAYTKANLGIALVASAGPSAGDRGKRLAMLHEARALLAEVAVFVAENRVEKFMVISDQDMKEYEDAVRGCDEGIARLAPA